MPHHIKNLNNFSYLCLMIIYWLSAFFPSQCFEVFWCLCTHFQILQWIGKVDFHTRQSWFLQRLDHSYHALLLPLCILFLIDQFAIAELYQFSIGGSVWDTISVDYYFSCKWFHFCSLVQEHNHTQSRHHTFCNTVRHSIG